MGADTGGRGIEPLPDELQGRPIYVSCSGGKDSVATVLALREAGVSIAAILCADTGWEALEWYEWMARLPGLLGLPVTMVRADIEVRSDLMPVVAEVEAALGISPSPMVRRMLGKGLFPSRVMRWCTDDLKAAAMDAWRDEHGQDDAIIATGVRAGESRARAGYQPVEWMRAAKQWHWRPILRWSLQDVLDIHQRHGIPLCPVYSKGVNRVGCWPCIPAANKGEIRAIAETDARRVAAVALLEAAVMAEKRRRFGDALGERQMWNDPLASEGSVTWAQMVEWSQTKRGGRTRDTQLGLWSRQEMSLPCRRMGYCDTAEGGDDDAYSC